MHLPPMKKPSGLLIGIGARRAPLQFISIAGRELIWRSVSGDAGGFWLFFELVFGLASTNVF